MMPMAAFSTSQLWGLAAWGFGVVAFIATGWLSVHLYRRWRQKLHADLTRSLPEIFVFLSVERWVMRITYAIPVIAVLVMIVTGSAVAMVLVMGLTLLPRGLARWWRHRRRRQLRAQLPDTLQLLAGTLRAGVSLPQAMGLLAVQLPKPSAEELTLIVRQQRVGVGLEVALNHYEQRLGFEEAAMFVAALRTALAVGGNLADTLERVASALRERMALEGKVQALTSQGRLQGWVISALPVGLVPVLQTLDPDAMRPFWTTFEGGAVAVGVAVFIGLGALWIRRIVNIDI